MKSPLLIALLFIAASMSAQPLDQVEKLIASDPDIGARMGYSVAISGDHALAGAPDDNESVQRGGAVYVFRRHASGSWQESQKLMASDADSNAYFGWSLDVSDGRAIIGAAGEGTGGSNAGAAYIFEQDGTGMWQEVQKLVTSDVAAGDNVGYSVAIDGDRAIVGARLEDAGGSNAGAAYVFERDGSGVWQEVQKLTASDAASGDLFGFSASISGDRAIVGSLSNDVVASDQGAAYVFERDGSGVWQEVQILIASDAQGFDEFGSSVSVSGGRALVGAWKEDGGAFNGGAVYIFERDGLGVWQEVQKLVAPDPGSNDSYGRSVDIDGHLAIIGAYREDSMASDAGAAYLIERDGSGVWQHVQKLVAADGEAVDHLAYSVSISNGRVLLGSAQNDQPGFNGAGAAYVFETPSFLVFDTIAKCDSAWVNGTWYDMTGTVTDSLTTVVDGFDSVVITTLTIHPSFQVDRMVMADDSANVNGVWYTSSQVIVDSLVTVDGCDSVVTTDLTINMSTAVRDLASAGIFCRVHGGMLTVDLTRSDMHGQTDVFVTDLSGRTIARVSDVGREIISIRLSEATGIYMVTVVQDGRRYMTQVAIMR